MLKRISFSVIFTLFIGFAFAEVQNMTVDTYYEKGVFYTKCVVPIEASEAVTNSVMDDFIRQYKNNLDSLFMWGFKDMQLQGEGDELIVYHLTSSTYNEETGIIEGKMDAIVPNLISFKDITIEGTMDKVPVSDKQTRVVYNIIDASAFLKEAKAVFNIIYEDEKQAVCTLDVEVRFGWFFNIFITQKRYKKNLEWRFVQLAGNLQKEAERRQEVY